MRDGVLFVSRLIECKSRPSYLKIVFFHRFFEANPAFRGFLLAVFAFPSYKAIVKPEQKSVFETRSLGSQDHQHVRWLLNNPLGKRQETLENPKENP